MHRLFLLISIFFSSPLSSLANDSIPVRITDVNSAKAIVTALYDVISGPAGQSRDWDRMRTLFTPEARMIATGVRANGSAVRKAMTIDEYIQSSGPFLEKEGFFETEVSNKTESYGNMVHVFSTYESRKRKEDPRPFMRGINSIQLWNDGTRWWVINVLWQSETQQVPIPQQYLR